MSDNTTPKEIVFAPGCFDDFEGTQEELDMMMEEITAMFENEDFLENSTLVDMETLWQTDPELYAKLAEQLADDNKRNLQ
jgi:hypothetical protein